MAKFRPGLRQITRALLIRGIAALLLLQTIALAYSQARPAPSEPGLAAAGQICRPLSDGGHAPARSDGAGHCLFCPISCAHGDAELATFFATAILLLDPRDAAATGLEMAADAGPRPAPTGFRQFSRPPPAA